jgi:hypothetical protein
VRSTFDELAKELAELRDLVASISPVNSVLAGHHDSLVRQYLTIRRRFDYAAFAVALYASFEKFAENLVAAYARLVTLRTQYAALPSKLVRKHMARSADILARGRAGEGRYLNIREIDLLKNLLDCVSGITPYSLNVAAIVAHDLNLRFDEINVFFTTIGIDHVCSLARRGDAMVKWFCESNGFSDPPEDGVPISTIQQRIDDVVERRNQVTHRGGSPLDLLGSDEMTDTIAFVEALSKSIFAITIAKYLEGRHIESDECAQLRICEGPYKDGAVVVVQKPEQRLYVGQPIFVLIESAGARWGRIRGLQLQGTSVEAVEGISKEKDVGVTFDFKCPKNAKLFVLEDDDDAVWGL